MEISTKELAALLEVSGAYAVRTRARLESKSAKSRLEEAKADFARWGGYEDCGPSYQSSFDAAEGIFNAAVQEEIHSEHVFKKVRLTAIENHPSLEVLIAKFIYIKQGKNRMKTENQPVASKPG